jgi:putative phosphonoacetaldehyde dehydrogenase
MNKRDDSTQVKAESLRVLGQHRKTTSHIPVFNPFTSGLIGLAPKATVQDVEDALAFAKAYQCKLTRFERSEILSRAGQILKSRVQEASDLITAESGLCKKDSLYEVGRVSDVLHFSSIETLRDDGQSFWCDLTPHGKRRRVFSQREPLLGVITAITPFNHPMNQVAHKIAPSIATGNRMLLKPSEKTPLSAYLLADILYEAGLPPEMLQVINGDPQEIAPTLVTHRSVDLVTFTGGVEIGKHIASMANYKRLVLELGGNDPLIVMEDADLDEASTLAALGSYKNSGQRCTAVKRMLVHESVADEFVDLLVDKTRSWSYGDPMDPEVNMGTVIDEQAAILFESRVNQATADGAKCLYGNNRKGALYSPTVLDHVHPEMNVVKYETFGPVSPVIRFKTIDDAINLVNSTDFGLSSAVCSNRLDYISRFVNELQVGTINVREVPGYRLELTPFGGIKDSGLGYKEGVQEAIKSFTNLKTFSLPWGIGS